MSYLAPFPSYRDQIIAFDIGVPLFNSLVHGKPVNFGLRNLASKTRNITLSCGAQHILTY